MAIINCPECGKEISDQAVACPNCGYAEQSVIKQRNDSEQRVKNIKRIGIISAIGISLVIILIALLPAIRVAMLSEKEKCLYQAITELRKVLLNEDSLQVKEAYVAIDLPEDSQEKNIVLISYVAQNRGGGYTDDIVAYAEFKSGNKKLHYDRTEELKNADDMSFEEFQPLFGETITYEILVETCLLAGEELPAQTIEKVMKLF